MRKSKEQAPGHPFYLEVNIDASSRPAPQELALSVPKGHEELAEPWVGAGDLKVGDKIRQADGTTGTVRIVKTEQKNQTMYNLDVANLDNFYVGEQGWLVHNCNVDYQELGGLKRDVLTKGFHINSDIGELSLLPRRLSNGTIEITVGPAGTKTGTVTKKVVKGVGELLANNPADGIAWARGIITTFGDETMYAGRVAQAQLIIEALTNGSYNLIK